MKLTKYKIRAKNSCNSGCNEKSKLFIKGKNHANKPLEIKWYILAKEATGPYIPTTPAIILAKQLVNQTLLIRGAMPCVNLIPLASYLDALDGLPIRTITRRNDGLPVD